MAKIYSNEIKQEARNLRSKGWSLGEISLKMQIPKNTLSGWAKDIRLSETQRKRLKRKEILFAAKGRVLAAKLLHEKMEQWKEKIKRKTQHFGNVPFKNHEIGKLICGLLYLCEGAKYPASRYLYFGNSDPKLILFFLTLLKKFYSIDENKLRFGISYRWDQDYEQLKNYWSKMTNIPKAKCLRTKPDIRSKGKRTLRKNYRGVCRIVYYDTSLQFELQSIGESVITGGVSTPLFEPTSREPLK